MASNKIYVALWALLVLATLAEVTVRSLSISLSVLIIGIIAISTAKAVSIALYFQHLRYEPKVLAILPLAAIVVLSTLLITALLSLGM